MHLSKAYIFGTILLWCLCSSACSPKIDPAFVGALETHRSEYKASFLSNERSPLNQADLDDLDFYAPKPNFQVAAKFEETPDAKPFQMATYSGMKKVFVQRGTLHFQVDGKPYALEAYQNLQYASAYPNQLFVPFKDATNGDETYGGGRYIDLDLTDVQDGQIVLDFNKCYNPWCAYSDGFNCPIPPLANHLAIDIRAGERKFKGAYKGDTSH